MHWIKCVVEMLAENKNQQINLRRMILLSPDKVYPFIIYLQQNGAAICIIYYIILIHLYIALYSQINVLYCAIYATEQLSLNHIARKQIFLANERMFRNGEKCKIHIACINKSYLKYFV